MSLSKITLFFSMKEVSNCCLTVLATSTIKSINKPWPIRSWQAWEWPVLFWALGALRNPPQLSEKPMKWALPMQRVTSSYNLSLYLGWSKTPLSQELSVRWSLTNSLNLKILKHLIIWDGGNRKEQRTTPQFFMKPNFWQNGSRSSFWFCLLCLRGCFLVSAELPGVFAKFRHMNLHFNFRFFFNLRTTLLNFSTSTSQHLQIFWKFMLNFHILDFKGCSKFRFILSLS